MKILSILFLFFGYSYAYSTNMTLEEIGKLPIETRNFVSETKVLKCLGNNNLLEILNKYSNFLSRHKNQIHYCSPEFLKKWVKIGNIDQVFEQCKEQPSVSHASQDERWGSTFRGLTKFHHDILVSIAKKYEENNHVRPKVLDLGSGLAWIAPLILAAGGEYVGVELVHDVAFQANKNIWATRNIWTKPGETSKDLYRIVKANILNESLIKKFEQNFDFVICINLLHFYARQDVEIIAQRVEKWLNDNGKAFIQADSPYLAKQKDLRNIYEEAQIADPESCGEFVVNSISSVTVYNINGNLSQKKSCKLANGNDSFVLKPINMQFQPGKINDGFFKSNEEIILNDYPPATKNFYFYPTLNNKSLGHKVTIKHHSFSHLFNLMHIQHAFSTTDLKFVNGYYIDQLGQEATEQEAKQNLDYDYKISLILVKQSSAQ